MPIYICFDVITITSVMQIFDLDKPKTVPSIPPMCFSLFHWKWWVPPKYMVTWQGSVNLPYCPLLPLKMRQKQAQRVREPTLIKTSKLKCEIITQCAVFSFNCIFVTTGSFVLTTHPLSVPFFGLGHCPSKCLCTALVLFYSTIEKF